MPERNLVTHRLADSSRVRKNNRQTLALPLIFAGLVFVNAFTVGCSNFPLRTLDDTPLPLPPSQTAIAQKVDDPREQKKIEAKSSASDSKSLSSEVDSSETDAAGYSIDDFLPPATRSKPQPDARIIGVYEKAEMQAVKLKATASLPPAPTIALAAHTDDEESTEKTPHQHDENCDCLTRKALPKLKKVEPLDPEAFIASTRSSTDSNTQTLGTSRSLRPLATPAETVSAPNAIRLTARPKAATVLTASQNQTTAVPETANRAQMLIPIAPEVLKKFKADSMRRAQAEAEAFAQKMAQQSQQFQQAQQSTRKTITDAIVVDPKITLPDPNRIPAPATNAIQTFAEPSNSNTSPDSPGAIRVSTKPFESLRSAGPGLYEQTRPATALPSVKPSTARSGEASSCGGNATCQCSQCKPCKCKTGQCQCRPTISTIFGDTNSLTVRTRSSVEPVPTKPIAPTLTDFEPPQQPSPSAFEPSKPVTTVRTENNFEPTLPNNSQAGKTAISQDASFALPEESPVAPQQAAAQQTAAVQEPAGLTELPDMAAIEKSLADFDKANTFDPASIDATHSVDPEMLKAKLKSTQPASSQPQPERFAQKIEPSASAAILAKQIASQQSTLQELQSAISELKPKAPPVAEPAKPKFKIGNAAFCTRIEGFGQFTPFASNTFANRQRTLLYCEIENQTSNRFADGSGTAQFETLLQGSISIYDANGNVVQSESFPQIKDVARQRRRDFYVYFPLTLENLADGDYRLELSIEDELGKKKATLSPAIRFSVR